MTETNLSDALMTDLADAMAVVMSINWGDMTDPEYPGACIPISYALNEFFALRGRPSRVAETTMEARDPLNAQWTQVEPSDRGFMGHAVVLLPSNSLLLDGALWSQKSKVLANFDIPKLVIAKWKRGLPSYHQIGRLRLKWEPNLTANTWRKGRWPWRPIKEAVIDLDRMMR